MAIADYNKYKDLDVKPKTGSTLTSASNSGSNTGTLNPLTFEVELKETGFLSLVGFEPTSSTTVTVEIKDSSSNVLASKSVGVTADTWNTVEFKPHHYSRKTGNEFLTVSISGANILYGQGYSFASVPMSVDVEDFPSADLSGGGTALEMSDYSEPTVNKAQPVLLVGGNDSTTGTGDIVLDWTNISSESDIAVYDSNGNLLPYEIEDFDATAETAVLWCYSSWVRDDSVQAQVLYGSGPTTSEEGTATDVWGNTGQNALIVQHLNETIADETTGNIVSDSSPNGNDGTVNGAEVGVSGEFDGAASFDGTDDYIDITGISSANQTYTFLSWVKGTSDVSQYILDTDSGRLVLAFETAGTGVGVAYFDGSWHESGNTLFDGNWHQVVFVLDASSNTGEIFVDGTSIYSDTYSGLDIGGSTALYSRNDGAATFYNGEADENRLYESNNDVAWIQADYDASPKAGQVFFSQSAAQTTTKTFSGTVTESGTAVQGAEVVAVNDTTGNIESTVTTDVNGDYSFSVSAINNHHLAVQYVDGSSNEFNAVSKPYVTADQNRTSLDFELLSYISPNQSSVDFEFNRLTSISISETINVADNYGSNYGTLTGQVTLDGSPVQGAKVYAVQSSDLAFVGSDTTDSNGNYEIFSILENQDILAAVDYDDAGTLYGEEKSIQFQD